MSTLVIVLIALAVIETVAVIFAVALCRAAAKPTPRPLMRRRSDYDT